MAIGLIKDDLKAIIDAVDDPNIDAETALEIAKARAEAAFVYVEQIRAAMLKDTE